MAKTALTQLIESLEKYRDSDIDPHLRAVNPLNYAINTAKNLLEKERQQIIDAYEQGGANVIKFAMLEGYDDNELPINSEQYYTENFEK